MAKSARSTKKRRAKAAKKKPVKHRVENSPDNPKVQLAVWGAYDRLRSTRRVATELDLKEWVVRGVLESDPQKRLEILDMAVEDRVADWESAGAAGHDIIRGLLILVKGMLAEITSAAEEGRMTVIRDANGYLMPVTTATQFLIVTKVLDQISRIVEKAETYVASYRAAKLAASAEGATGLDRFDGVDEDVMAQKLLAAGIELPPGLAAKIKARQAAQA